MQSDVPQLGESGLILEGIVTTENRDGTVNVAPMGPIVESSLIQMAPVSSLLLRPYKTSTTYENLKRNKRGVFHITDDVELFAAATVGKAQPALEGLRIVDACRWHEFRVTSIDDRQERTIVYCATIRQGTQREFLGFNRAKHAVIEAAILVTRISILPREELSRQFDPLRVLVEKTGSRAEHRAFSLLSDYLAESP